MELIGNHPHGRPLRPGRAIALVLIGIFFVLATLMGSLALSITAPTSIAEGQTLSVSASGTGTITITHNGNIVATGTNSASYNYPTDNEDAGLHQFGFSDNANGESRTIEITDTPLDITITSPTQNDLATNSVTFSLTTNWQPEFCYVNIDGTSRTLTATTPTAHTGTFSVLDGVRTIEYKCKLGSELATKSKTLHIDTKAPTVLASSPSGEVTGPYVTLNVDTDEIATCRYGQEDVAYESLPSVMSATYVLRNTATLEVTTHGSLTYFVRCQDVNSNTMQSARVISFLNKMPPTAEIELDGEEPYKAGTYKVTVKTSTPLADMPVVRYILTEAGRTQQVALTGDGAVWEGYVVIPSDIKDTILSFTFSGTTPQGVTGSQITEGALVTIDALPPEAVDVLSIVNSSEYMWLRWYSTDAEDHDSYNIYRSEHEGVQYTDYYRTTDATDYIDHDAQGARYYYYKVAPVDAAGNIGPLSQEVYGSVIDSIIAPTTDPLITARLDDAIASLEGAMMGANATLKALEEESNPTYVQIIKDMQLIDQGKQAAMKLESALLMLQEFKLGEPSAAEADAVIARATQLRDEANAMLIRKITANHQMESSQASDHVGLERNVAYAFIGIQPSPDERSDYLASAIELQDKITVNIRAMTFVLYDATNRHTEYTYVQKRVKLQDPVNDVRIIEQIPKTLASDVSEITFFKEPKVLESDPVIEYSFPVLQEEEFSYYVQRAVSLEEVKNSRTFVYPAFSTAPTKANELTGNVALDTGIPSSDMILIALGAVIIIVLGGYYVSLDQKPKRFKPAMPPAPTRASIITRPLQAAPIVARPIPAAQVRIETPQSKLDARELIAEAQRLIDNKEFDSSIAAYRKVTQLIEKDQDLGQILHDEISTVYAKLGLFRRVADAKEALEQHDKAKLSAALADVRHFAALVGEHDTRLIREAKASYAELARALNTLEIETVGRY